MSPVDNEGRVVGAWPGLVGLWPLGQPCGLAEPGWAEWDRLEAEKRRKRAEARARALRGIAAALRAALVERLRYRGDLLGAGLFLALVLFIFHRVWTAVAGPDGLVGEYTVAQLLTYLLVAELVVMGPGPVHLSIGEDVRSGAYVVSLLRPLSFAQWELGRAAGGALARVLALLAVGIAAIALLSGLPRVDPRGVAFGLLVLVPAALAVELCVRVLFGLAAFWIEDAGPLYWIWQKLAFVLGGLFLPLDFYPPWLRTVTDVLPFRALVYGPARTVVAWDPHQALHAVAALAAWGFLFGAALHVVEAKGRRRVQANGG